MNMEKPGTPGGMMGSFGALPMANVVRFKVKQPDKETSGFKNSELVYHHV